MLKGINTFLGNLSGADVTGTLDTITGAVTGASEKLGTTDLFKSVAGNVIETISEGVSQIQNPLTSDKSAHYLQPYSLLYDMTPTGLKYCLPMISNPPVLSVTNSYESS